MGVKGLWQYLEHHKVTYDPPRTAEGGLRSDSYTWRPEHLYVDMNAVLHIIYAEGPTVTSLALERVANHIRTIMRRVKPTRTLVIVFDGVAPLAKLATQKKRRENQAATPPAPAPRQSSSGSVEPYTCDVVKSPVPLLRAEITAGSEFVYACQRVVMTVLEKMENSGNATWKKSHVSFCTEDGEGEVKISRYIRRQWQADLAAGTFDCDDSFTIIGNDSDLVLVALAATPYSYFTIVDPSTFHMTVIKELLDHWVKSFTPPLRLDLLGSYRIDFVFIMLLSSCDYYEGLEKQVLNLWRAYRNLRSQGGYFRRALISGASFDVDVELLRRVISDANSGPHIQTRRISKNKLKTQKALQREGSGNASDGVVLLRAALWNLKSIVLGRCVDYAYIPEMKEQPTPGALRSAANGRSIATAMRTLRASTPTTTKENSCNKNNNSGNEETEKQLALIEEGSGEEASITALEQCVAILGVRGRFSEALSSAIVTCSPDSGKRLTYSTSAGFVVSLVKDIFAHVDRNKLSGAEKVMLRHTKCTWPMDNEDVAQTEREDEAGFITFSVIPPKAASAAP